MSVIGDLPLVIFSFGIAILASLTALDLAERVTVVTDIKRKL
jgi:NO-binding membrane sensor protein with MHYT domain